jgi:hypothetical protein
MYNCKLPSGIEISVNPPSFQDRMEAVKEFRQVKDEVGYSVEELMAAKCIASVGGNVVVGNDMMLDPILLLADWPNADVQFYIEWFMTLFFLDDKIKDKATNEAKKIMVAQQTGKMNSKK